MQELGVGTSPQQAADIERRKEQVAKLVQVSVTGSVSAQSRTLQHH